MNDAQELKNRYENFAASLDYNTTASDFANSSDNVTVGP